MKRDWFGVRIVSACIVLLLLLIGGNVAWSNGRAGLAIAAIVLTFVLSVLTFVMVVLDARKATR